MTEKLTLKEILGAIDLNAKTVWDDLTDDQRKSIVYFTLNRYLSSVQGSRETQEHWLLNTNLRFNKNLFELLNKHPKLLWQIACSCSDDSGQIYFHQWIKVKKEKNKKVDFLMKIFPNKKREDIELLAELSSPQDIKKYLEELGWSKKEINDAKL